METHEPSTLRRRPTRSSMASLVAARVDGVPPWALILQVFIGLGWLRAAAEKVISGAWWSGDTIRAFVRDHEAIPWFQPVIDNVVLADPVAVAVVVLVGQVAVGVSLLIGRRPGVALLTGMFLNLSFLAAGAVNPSAFYLLMQGAILLWIIEDLPHVPTRRWTSVASVGAGILALVSSPFVMTLKPEVVVDDPAIMLVTLGTLTVLACEAIERQHNGAQVIR